MVIIHFFEDLEDIIGFIKELYPNTRLDIYNSQLQVSRDNRVFEVQRLTIIIYTNNTQPIEAVDLFLRMKYQTYAGYMVNNIIPYKPTSDYTYPDRRPEDKVLVIVGSNYYTFCK